MKDNYDSKERRDVKRMTEDRIMKQMFAMRTTKKKPRKSPRRTWIEEAIAAALKRSVEWGKIIEATQDRKKWKEI